MSDLEKKFETAAADVQELSRKPDNTALLELYGLYKQATQGDVTGKRPGMLDLKGRAKYDAWTAKKGTSKEAAMTAYIELVETLKTAGS